MQPLSSTSRITVQISHVNSMRSLFCFWLSATVAFFIAGCAQESTGPRLGDPAYAIVYSLATINNINAHDLYVMTSDGGVRKRLTYLPGRDGQAQWSPDGSQIAFVNVDTLLQNSTVYVVNADGSGLKMVGPKDSQWRWPSWSPDGRLILGAMGSLAFMRTDGSDVQIIPGTTGAVRGALSSDGSRLLFTTFSDLWMLDLRRGTPVRIVSGGYPGAWSPGGNRIAFTGPNGITISNPDGSSPRIVVPARFADAGVWWNQVSWSADGRKLVFAGETGVGQSGHFDIYVVDVDGGSPVNITHSPGQFAYEPHWRRGP
jgi:Tol biopolymer transport system component